jgi:catalase
MPAAAAATYRFNPFDLTKVWPYRDYPLIPIGRLVLNRAPDSFFAEVEQAAFDPSNFVPGVGPSPDRMLQARLFAYGDAHRYRLGVNHTRLPVNAPTGVAGGPRNYGRDGAMRFDDDGRRGPNYEPNSYDAPAETGEAYELGYPVAGLTGPHAPVRHVEDDDFVQAGALYRVMKPDERARLIESISGSLAQVSREDVIARSIEHFRKADPEYGARLAEAVAAKRAAAGRAS